MYSDISDLKVKIRDIDKNISDIKNMLSTYFDYFKDHFYYGSRGTKNDEFKTPPSPLPARGISISEVIRRVYYSPY